jgi:hypothetical protein
VHSNAVPFTGFNGPAFERQATPTVEEDEPAQADNDDEEVVQP